MKTSISITTLMISICSFAHAQVAPAGAVSAMSGSWTLAAYSGGIASLPLTPVSFYAHLSFYPVGNPDTLYCDVYYDTTLTFSGPVTVVADSLDSLQFFIQPDLIGHLSGSTVNTGLTVAINVFPPDSMYAGHTNVADDFYYLLVRSTPSIFTSITDVICYGDSFFFANEYHSVPGVYRDTFTASTGADSIVELTLLVAHPQPVITQSGSTLSTGSFAGYIWFSDSSIVGSTQQIQATQNGDYTVQVVDSNGCLNVSPVFTVTGVDVEQITTNTELSLYPNPATEVIQLKCATPMQRVTIINSLGQDVCELTPMSKQTTIHLNDLQQGIYLLRVKVKDGVLIRNVIKN